MLMEEGIEGAFYHLLRNIDREELWGLHAFVNEVNWPKEA